MFASQLTISTYQPNGGENHATLEPILEIDGHRGTMEMDGAIMVTISPSLLTRIIPSVVYLRTSLLPSSVGVSTYLVESNGPSNMASPNEIEGCSFLL